MLDQPAFSGLEHQGKKRKTRREQFLERIDALLPWQKLEGRIHPFYPKAGRGRKVRYRGLMKNTQRLALLFGLGNLLTAEGQLRV